MQLLKLLLNLTDRIPEPWWLWLLIAALATFRLTSILYEEDIARPIRKLFGVKQMGLEFSYPTNFLGSLFSCFWCISVWVAFGVSCLLVLAPVFLLPFALSTAAIWIKGLIHGNSGRTN